MNKKIKKQMIGMTAILLIALVFSVGCGKEQSENTSKKENTNLGNTDVSSASKSTETEEDDDLNQEMLSGKHHVEIKIRDYGTIKVELDADTAPVTVTNFVNLAKEGFYDGLTFHRVISGFMIQGGDPKGNGTGGSDQTITGEFSANDVKNDISHVRGTISMARAQAYDSASSQFFIVHRDSTYLDGQYAGFGTVTEGMEVVDKICENTPVQDQNGTVESTSQPVIESVIVID